MNRAILLHYHEINLKGGNRGWFEGRLHRHVEKLLHELPHAGVVRCAGRMIVTLVPESPVEEFVARLRCVFGVANFGAAWVVPANLDEIRQGLYELVQARDFASFKIDARRGTKDFPLNSQQLNEQLGAYIREKSGAAVRLENPELTCFVEIVGPRVFLYFEKIPAGGGLPSHTGGKVVCLLSGGIDSPVATFRIMRRGCHAVLVHFHSFPHTSMESQEKVRRITRILARYQLDTKLYLVPFGEVQRVIVAYAPAPLRVLLYRRFMVRIAESLARSERAAALVTGDSLGQVASQTLENLRAVSSAASLPIFRPLIGDDKEEIMNAARRIGTYDVSILPDQDCCTMFVPRHPETMARPEQLEEAERSLDGPSLVGSAVSSASHETIAPDFDTCPAGRSGKP